MIKRVTHHRAPADILAVLSGLLVAQLVATIAVLVSNRRILDMSIDLQSAGWQPIPTGPALETLPTIGAAMRGGLFFTLSIGAGSALGTWALVRLIGHLFNTDRSILVGAVFTLMAGCLIYINFDGTVWFPSIIVSGVILTTGLIIGGPAMCGPLGKRWWAPALALLLITGLWATQFNRGLFTTIRDHLLLSNPIGSKVNDFYYKNTLYAAEVFKSFSQKTLRTCRVTGFDDPERIMRLTKHLAKWDILVVDGKSRPDLTIAVAPTGDTAESPQQSPAAEKITLVTKNNRKIETDIRDLATKTKHWLAEVSTIGDTFAPFRKLTFLGLLIGFPVLLYLMIYTLLRGLTGLIFKDTIATVVASALCLAIGIGMLIPIFTGSNITIPAADIDDVLQHGSRPQRIALLRQLEKQKAEIDDYPGYRTIMAENSVVERYYLARILAHSKRDRTYNDLLTLASDPHINVTCQAYYAIGQRGKPPARGFLLARIQNSPDWYAQYYGYNALRTLGWRQTASKPRP